MTQISRRALLSSAAAGLAASRRTNFLFILADDHAGYVLGCDGNRAARTPNLDRLARRVPASPRTTVTRRSARRRGSPSSPASCRMPPESRCSARRSRRTSPRSPNSSAKAGYQTAVYGKMHFNRPAEPGLHGFDLMMTEGEISKAWLAEVHSRPVPADIRTKPAQWRPFRDPARVWLNSDKLPLARFDRDSRGSYIARKAGQYLEAAHDRPFALWVSFPGTALALRFSGRRSRTVRRREVHSARASVPRTAGKSLISSATSATTTSAASSPPTTPR